MSDRYYATTYYPLHGWQIVDADTHTTVDVARTATAAAYRVEMLNAGCARVDAHGTLGCRIVMEAR